MVLFIIIGGDADTGATAAGPVDVNDHARPRRGVTNTQQPNLTPFVSVTY